MCVDDAKRALTCALSAEHYFLELETTLWKNSLQMLEN